MKILNRIKAFFTTDYYVFRRFRQINSLYSKGNADVIIKEAFALHFVEPFKSKKKARKAIKNANHMQPWQEFIILKG